MNIPNFFRYIWTRKDGQLTEEAALYMDSVNQTLQDNLSDNGWVVPTITQADLATLQGDPNTAMPNGTIWYVVDSVTSPTYYELVLNQNGTLMKVDLSAYP